MRKTLILLLTAVLLITMALPALAATYTYEIPELKLTLEIPAEYHVFLRESTSADAWLTEYGMTKTELLNIMKSSDIYLDAFAEDATTEIVVTMTDNIVRNMHGLGDAMLTTISEEIVAEYDRMDLKVTEYDLFRREDMTFIRISYHDSECYALQYYTIVDYRALNFMFYSYDGVITAYHERLMEDLINSIRMDVEAVETTEKPEVVQPTETEKKPVEKPQQEEKKGGFPLVAVLIGAAVGAGLVLLRRKPSAHKAVKREQPKQMAIFCHMCGSATMPDSDFCYKCGAQLKRGLESVPVQAERMPTFAAGTQAGKKIFCDHCGERLLLDSNFCRKCGKKVSQ